MSPEILAGAASLVAVLVLTLVNFRRGWSKASGDYVATLKGLLEAKDSVILDRNQTIDDLKLEVRRLNRIIKALNGNGNGNEGAK